MKFTSDKSSYSNYHDVAKKRLHFFLLLIALGAFFVIGYMIVTGNEAQVYKDVISEWTAWDSSNKSAERYLIYILSIFGAFTYIIYFVWTKMKYKDVFQPDSNMTEEKTTSDFVILLLVVSGIYYFIYSGTNPFIITAIICVVLFLLIDKTLVVPGLCAFFWSAYAINALYKIYVSFGGDKQFHAMISSFLSFLLVMVMSIGNFKKRNLLRGILISQIMIPFLLLIYIESKYKYGEEILTLHIPYKVHCFIGMLIIIFLLEAIYLLWKHWNQFSNIGNIISYGSCIAVMAFNRFSGTGAIISSDDHHPYENIIAFSQIFKLGQKPFDEYIPVSGMYSLVQGFFLDFFGHNKMEYYYLTQNIFYLCIIVVIVVLLKRQINGIYLLMISLIYSVLDYNRFAFVLPVMLLLSWPKLIEKKNTWLKAWFLTSYLQGLYYPVYGAAVCLGFLPMGIWQIIRYIKSGELLKAFKKGPFWIGWFLCCIPVIGGIPYLLGTFRHTLAMGGQTVCADGTSRFGQKIPDDFFNYINSVTIRLAIYYIFSFLILASIVWACIAICLEIGILQIKGKSLMLGDPIPVFITLACAITLMVSFSFTVIRLEIGDLYSRNKGIVNAVFVIFIILVGRYLQKGGLRRFVLGFSIFIVAVYINSVGIVGIDSKLSAYYVVPDNYLFVEKNAIEKLGSCFIEQSYYNRIERNYEKTKSWNKEEFYLGFFAFNGYFYYNLKGCSTMEYGTIRSFNAAEETINLLRKNKTNVRNINPVSNYYLYHWLFTSGEYVWSTRNECFVRNDDYLNKEEVQELNREINITGDNISLGRTASSWGLSIDSLSKIFSAPGLEYSCTADQTKALVNFKEMIDGDEADFVYLEFCGMDQNYDYILFDHIADEVLDEGPIGNLLLKKDYNRGMTVVVSWEDEKGDTHTMNCLMGQGKLLIPLGGGSCWLLHKQKGLTLSVFQNDVPIPLPEINKICFLKLREVQ